MNNVKELYKRLISSMEIEDLEIPVSLVKIFKKGDKIPESIFEYHPDHISLTSCQAEKQASLGDVICLTKRNIGCIAAAITFGLVDENDTNPLQGPRVYTDIMKEHSEDKEKFSPPSPSDFTEGLVYACKDANRSEFSLFGEKDSGRYKDTATAQKAIKDMLALQPAETEAVLFYSPEFEEVDFLPDVVVCSIRPVELTRFVQAYQFNTGKRIEASMGGLRAVNSDLIVRPYVTKKINVSSYCLGSRLIAQYEGDRLGIGIPFSEFEILVKGMEDSKTGFPFNEYPGAKE